MVMLRKSVFLSALAGAAVLGVADAKAQQNWTGFYAGVHAGYGWGGDNSAFFTPNDPYSVRLLNGTLSAGGTTGGQPVSGVSADDKGAFGGLQAGYNWQLNRSWLAGIESDFSWSRIRSNASTLTPLNDPSLAATFNVRQDVEWFGTLRGRLGWLATDAVLIYATGGLAYGKVAESLEVTTSGTLSAVLVSTGGFGAQCYSTPTQGQCFAASSTRTSLGWTAGAGAEIELSKNITLKTEYLYVDLGGNNSFTATTSRPFNGLGATPAANPTSFNVNSSDVSFHTVRAGINYKF